MVNYNTLLSSVNDAINVYGAASRTHGCFIRDNCESIADWVDEMLQSAQCVAYNPQIPNKTRAWADGHKMMFAQAQQDIENLRLVENWLRAKQCATSDAEQVYNLIEQYMFVGKNIKPNVKSIKRAIEIYADKIAKNNLRISLEHDTINAYLHTNTERNDNDVTRPMARIAHYAQDNARYEQVIANLKTTIHVLKHQKIK